MKILFSPQRSDASLEVYVEGDALIINGESFDFSPLQEGDVLPNEAISSDVICSDVTRTDGHIVVQLILPHPEDASEAQRFPVPMIISDNGKVNLPQ